LRRLSLALLFLAALFWAAPGSAQRLSNEEIRKQLMDESIASAGDCPCPYSYAWNGRQCANDSVYSKGGRQSVLCYPQDVTWPMIEDFRRRRGL
jgi:hypothetical protein